MAPLAPLFISLRCSLSCQRRLLRFSFKLIGWCFHCFEEARRLDGRRGAHPRGGDHLPEVRVGRLPRRKDTRHIRFHSVVDLDIAQIAHFQLTFEHLRIRRVTDKDEQTIRFIDRFFARLDILQFQRFQFIRADHFGDNGIQNKIDLWDVPWHASARLGWREIPRGDE